MTLDRTVEPALLAKRLSALYPWTSHPLIVAAPMRGLSGPALPVATQFLFRDLNDAALIINEESALHEVAPPPILPIGVGFQLWSDRLDAAATAIRKFQPCAAWLFAPAPAGGYRHRSRRIRSASPWTGIARHLGADWQSADRPDVTVVQGAEAGGHGRADDGMGLISLLPQVADILVRMRVEVPLVAAGGLADTRGAAAALCLGASGEQWGTCFLASERFCPRAIINRLFRDYQANRSRRVLKQLHDEAVKQGNAAWGPERRAATYAGATVGLIRDVKNHNTHWTCGHNKRRQIRV
ncbi:Nitronate monooxygenase-domain-containing protein [Aspergillus falconensis]